MFNFTGFTYTKNNKNSLKCDRQKIKPCQCPVHKPRPRIKLTELILDCWQRELDRKPYENLLIHRKFFEERLAHEFGPEDMKVLNNFLGKRKIKNLELLYIKLAPDSPDEEFIEPLADHLRNITALSLINVDLPVKLLKILSDRHHEYNMKLLRLTGNSLTTAHAEYLRCFVKYSPTLEYLDVGFCCLDEIRFAIIADGVHNSKSLKGVDMSKLEVRSPVSTIDETKISPIIAILLWKTRLVEVHFKGCFLDSHCMEPIAEYLGKDSALLYLDLGSNIIGPDGALILFKAIVVSKKLIGLDLSNNKLGSHGGEIIAHCLPKTRIRYLDIGRNGICAKAMHLLLSTIKKVSQIRILNIFGNEFDAKVAKMLHRQIEAKILLLETIDVDVTYSSDTDEFQVVPQPNNAAKFNERYHRIANPYKWPKCFFKQFENYEKTLTYHENQRAVLVNSMFVGPIIVDSTGQIISLHEKGPDIHRKICLRDMPMPCKDKPLTERC